MSPLFLLAVPAYGLVVLVAVSLCAAAKRGDRMAQGWRNDRR